MRERIILLTSILSILVFNQIFGQMTNNDAWINELHYDNEGADAGEFIEVVIKNASNYNLSDFTVNLYNGADSLTNVSESLSNFTAGNTVGDYTFFYWESVNLQNETEGISLDHQGNVLHFISYEGSIQALNGPASGMTSEDIGVSETGSSSTPIGSSLQLTGFGYQYNDFNWTGPQNDSPGAINTDQYLFPAIQFETVSASADEGGATYTLGVQLTNPDGNTVEAEIVFQQERSTAEAVDISDNITYSVQFGPGASDGEIQTVNITLNDDEEYEGVETAVFELANISSSTGLAQIIGQSNFNLSIIDNEIPNIVINEIHADPDPSIGDADGDGISDTDDDEFIEIVNAESISMDITDWYISDAQGRRHTFSGNTILPANGAAVVFGGFTSSGHFGGAIVQDTTTLGLNNGGDTVTLYDASGNVIDAYTYGGEAGENQSVVRSPEITGNFIKHSEAPGSSGALYSPGTKTDGSIFSTSIILEGTAGWRMLSAPVENLPLSEITDDVPIQGIGDSDEKNFYTGYDGNAFTAPSNLSGNLNSGEGFILYVFNNNSFNSTTLPVILDVGTNSEPSVDVTVPLHANGDHWNLLGNPYQTAFDVTSLAPNGGELGSSVGHIWSNTDGSYILTSSNDDKVAPGQGFFIRNDETNPATSVTLPVSGKATGTRFYKSNDNEATGYIQLALLSEHISDGSIQKDLSTVLYFHESAIVGEDVFDAEKLFPLKPAYSLLGFKATDTDLLKTQDSRPYFGESEEYFEIGLMASNVRPKQSIKWEKASNIPEEWEFLFIDNQTGEEVVMDENFNYTFHHEDRAKTLSIEASELNFPVMASSINSESRFTIILNRGTATSTDLGKSVPDQFKLQQNYPNPFNPVTQIRYDVPTQSKISIEVFNLMGQKVTTLVDQVMSPGSYRAIWNASAQASGVYYYRLKAGNTVMTRKMTLIK